MLVEGEGKPVSEKLVKLLEGYRSKGQKIGLLLSEESREEISVLLALKNLGPDECFLLGSRKKPEIAARRLFEGLRKLDSKALDVIVADGSFSHSGLGEALINRLREASSIKLFV